MIGQRYLSQLHQKLLDYFSAEELKTVCFGLGVNYDDVPGEERASKAREVLQLVNRLGRVAELVKVCQKQRSHVVWEFQARLFIAYERHTQHDHQLAAFLRTFLTERGHQTFIDLTPRTGMSGPTEIDKQIKTADFLLVLLSQESADSEMVQAQVQRAHDYHQKQGYPQILPPVRLNYLNLLPYTIAAFFNPIQYVSWESDADNVRVGEEIVAAINGRLPPKPPLSLPAVATGELAEDGRLLSQTAPLPEFDPRLLQTLSAPGGAVRLSDKLYVRRTADAELEKEVLKWGSTTTIRAPRQTGKTSLLMRGLHHARQQGAKTIFFDFQNISSHALGDQGQFLRQLAETIAHELRLAEGVVAHVWQGNLDGQQKLTYFCEDHVLPSLDAPLVLAIDEADALLKTDFYRDFFALLRSWHNLRANKAEWEKLNIVLVISTEPYLLIDDINLSPFNVGSKLTLDDFDITQVQWLNAQHGSPIAAADLPSVMALLNGHPYLTRKLLYLLAKQEKLSKEQAIADDGPFGDHLRRLHWRLRNHPKLQDALRQIIATGRCRDEDALLQLLKAGLVMGSGDSYRCRCDLYTRYFRRKLT